MLSKTIFSLFVLLILIFGCTQTQNDSQPEIPIDKPNEIIPEIEDTTEIEIVDNLEIEIIEDAEIIDLNTPLITVEEFDTREVLEPDVPMQQTDPLIGDREITYLENDFILIEMPHDRGIDQKETQIALTTSASQGYVALILNCEIISLDSLDGESSEGILEELLFNEIEPIENCEDFRSNNIFSYNVNLLTEIEEYGNDEPPGYLADVSVPIRENNVLSAVLLDKSLNLVAQNTVMFSTIPVLLSLGVISNVSYNGSDVALLNNTQYNATIYSTPRNYTFVMVNGSTNTTVNVNRFAKIWMRTKFQDINIPPGFTDWRWIQIVTSNLKTITPATPGNPSRVGYHNPAVSFVDPPANFNGEDNLPFYYNANDLARLPGLNHFFIDHPLRAMFPSANNQYVAANWSAEVCHVGVRNGQPDVILKDSCMTWGLVMREDGSVGRLRLTPSGSPSQNYQDTLRRDFPNYDFEVGN